MEARAFWTVAPGRGEIRAQPLPAVGPEDVRVRTLWTGISRGSESLVFSGHVPESQCEAMRAPFQEGVFPAPVKYGYCAVGIVEEGPPALKGRPVFCLHPHQTRFVTPAAAVAPLPDGLPSERAVLAANMETAINGLWDLGPRLGDRIAVVGAGVVGCLVAYLASRIPGTAVTLVDIDPGKAKVAEALEIAFATPGAAPADQDQIVHASGAPEGLSTALSLAGFEATVLEMSWFGDRPVPAPLGEAFHSRRLTLRASQVGAVATAQRARWDHARRMALALGLLRDDRLDALIDGESDFDDLPETMARLAAGRSGALCHRIRYPA
ncbi:zinc-binding alcohol dehydrogenase [Inquilinus sp. CAU 1745]|uniref:zinc-dependent alcohol dehydrogenase n=1 Tax=Inquilinus sp. CAU 1745 TaxID=3140369 RepID=UPI00325ADE6C